MDKKAELEIKKAKLAELKKQRDESKLKSQLSMLKSENVSNSNLGNLANSSTSSIATTSIDVDPDSILIECGITAPIQTSMSGANTSSATSLKVTVDDGSTQKNSNLTKPQRFTKSKKPFDLCVSKVNVLEIAPKELVTYSKETQTPSTDISIDKEAKPVDYYVLTYDNNEDDDSSSMEVIASNNLKLKKKTDDDNKSDSNKQDEKNKVLIKEASDEDKVKILQNDEFIRFFTRNTRILEKALDQDDIFFDYSGADKNKEIIETGEVFKLNREFQDDRWKNRIVTWMDWSPHYPELLLASYDDSALDPDGVVLVWNSKFKLNCPEYIFNCSSWVTSCCFAKFHPNLIIGGTYSGQIVMWDNRSNKRTPIQRSSLSASSHTHPVYCIQIVGSQNAHNLISISNDGKLCSWTLDNMNTPQETLDLQFKQKNIAVTTMSFKPGDVNNFIVGSEEGPIYTSTRHGNKSGVNECFEGHYGPVSGLSLNQATGSIDFSHIFVTSSFDWSIKLWNAKEPGKALYSFENNSDYVYDVNWSPVHPALFASIDGTGRLDLWNLINDTEVPTATLQLDGSPALNKVRWTANGQQIIVGDDQGKISLFDVNENFSQPRNEDWNKFVHVLQDLKENRSELEEALNVQGVAGQTLNPAVGSSGATTPSMPAQLGTPMSANALQNNKSDPSLFNSGSNVSLNINNILSSHSLIQSSSSSSLASNFRMANTPK